MQIVPKSIFPNYYLKFWNVKRMIFSRQEVNMSKYTEITILLFFLNILLITTVGALGYSCPIGHVATYILSAI